MKIVKTKNSIFYLEGNDVLGKLDFRYPDDCTGKRNLELKYLYVKPLHRRKGIGSKLLKYAIKKFKRCTWINFWTGYEAEIDKSYRMFSKLGFKQLAYMKDYYEDGIGTRLFVLRK